MKHSFLPLTMGKLVKCECGEDAKNCWHTFKEQVEIYPPMGESGPVAIATSEERAHFIVLACNHFKEMREALDSIRAMLDIALDEDSAGHIGSNLIVRDRLKKLLRHTDILSRIEEAERD